MAISGDYATPVQVNGYLCRNCTDVDNAKKHIDPQHPKSGPYGVAEASDPSRNTAAVRLDGLLKGLSSAAASPAQPGAAPYVPGSRLDLQA